MTIKPFQAVYPNLEAIPSPDTFFDTVKYDYAHQAEQGFFLKNERKSMFVYQIRTAQRAFTGLVACADIHDYLNGRIKKHENTIATGEKLQMDLMLNRAAAVKPVLQTFPAVPELHDLLKRYTEENPCFLKIPFFTEKQEHIFWEVNDPQTISQLQDIFAKQIPCTYIADGHHRTATTALLFEQMGEKAAEGAYDLLLSVYLPSDELDIHAFNRLVEGLEGISDKDFMKKIGELCDIETLPDIPLPFDKHEMVMLLNHVCYKLHWKKEVLDRHKDDLVIFDVSLLNEYILRDLLNITDVRTDKRLKYIEGPKGWEGILDKKKFPTDSVAFFLHPLDFDELVITADAGQTLPPKSTWFEPRVKNGLLVLEH